MSDLAGVTDIKTVTVRVGTAAGPESNIAAFCIVPATVGSAEVAVALPGETATVSTLPTSSTEPGVLVEYTSNGSEPVTVVAASYDTKPTGETVFKVDSGSFVDVQFTGATSADKATVYFYYPASITGGAENKVKLRYFNGADWVQVLSTGGAAPVKNTTDNLDGTTSGGRFTVEFSATSRPTITDLNGTIFGMIDPTPQILTVTGPADPAALGSAATVGVAYALPNPGEPCNVTFNWLSGTSQTVINNTGSASSPFQYAAAGVYTVGISVKDADENEATRPFQYVVVYDPNSGFVTGGGWIDLPAGAYTTDPTLAGKANFGFVSKYEKGANKPTGNTEFQFKAGDLNYKSTSYEWLVVSGALAQYKVRERSTACPGTTSCSRQRMARLRAGEAWTSSGSRSRRHPMAR